MGSKQSFPKSQNIAKEIKIFGTNTCPYCVNAKNMFQDMGAQFEFINTRDNPQKRDELSKQYNWDTIPMIFVDGKFYGGYTDTKQKILSGELKI
ncbi:hypothetical protein ABPG72_018608 [Tetrahymena utriculariae]